MVNILLQFAVILFVVMMGFAMPLYYPLLRDNNGITFGAVLLLLFKTLLGDVEAFEEFDEITQDTYSTVGRLVLVVYLVLMAIMLLNLLIAVLSTKHAKVDESADVEFKVSKARLIEHYRQAVAFEIIPAPFNLCQLVLSLPFLRKSQSEACTKTKEAVGLVFFWLVLSPLVFAAGVLLWFTSSMYYIFQTLLRFPSKDTENQSFRGIRLIFWCALGAPPCLLALWLRQPFLFICNGGISRILPGQDKRGVSKKSASSSGHTKSDIDVQTMLREAGAGGRELRRYLEDPMCDPDVRPDEVDRGTTMKHIKLLRDRLEKKIPEGFDHFGKECNERLDRLEKKFDNFNERVDHLGTEFKEHIDYLGTEFKEHIDHLGTEFKEHIDHLDQKFSKYADHFEKKLNEHVDSLETNKREFQPR